MVLALKQRYSAIATRKTLKNRMGETRPLPPQHQHPNSKHRIHRTTLGAFALRVEK